MGRLINRMVTGKSRNQITLNSKKERQGTRQSERERQRQTDRQTDRDRERHRHRHRERQREKGQMGKKNGKITSYNERSVLRAERSLAV